MTSTRSRSYSGTDDQRAGGKFRTGRTLALAGAAAVFGYLAYSRALRRRALESGSAVGTTVSACSQVTVQRSATEVYEFLHDLGNLPRFSRFITEAVATAPSSWRLVAAAPWSRGVVCEVQESVARPGERLAWRSAENSPIACAADVRLIQGDRGTEVYVDSWLVPPVAGLLAPALRRAEESRPLRRAGLTPSKVLRHELGRMKQLLESGETATTRGQSSGRAA